MRNSKTVPIHFYWTKKDKLVEILESLDFRVSGFRNFEHVYVKKEKIAGSVRDLPIAVITATSYLGDYVIGYDIETVNLDEPELRNYHKKFRKIVEDVAKFQK